MSIRPFVIVLISSVICFAAAGHCRESEKIPSLVESIQFKKKIRFCNTLVPLANPQVRAQLEKEMLLALWDRPQVILWMKRSAVYFPIIEKILAQEKLPGDLKYVPVIESALRPHASSSANAVGYWQFLKSTARRYGLRVDARMDERRNIFKSTRAACRYLKKLYNEFGSYPLALSAYNMGEHGLATEIDAQQIRDYFQLYLPLETQRYVFKMIAAKLILEAPERYGFILSKNDFYPPLTVSHLNFTSDREIPLVLIARAAGLSFKELKMMNPDVRGYYLAPGKASLMVPKGREKGFKQAFAALLKTYEQKAHSRFHVVQPGESLIGIAQKYNMSLAALLRLNNFSFKKVIHPGDRLKVR